MSKTYRSQVRTRENRRYRVLKNNPDTGKTIALVALGGAVAYGAYLLLFKKAKPGIPDDLTITKYQNTRTGVITSSGFLDVLNGDMVKVYFEYGYFGPALSGTYHVSLWQKSVLDPHDEVGPTDKLFDIPAYSELTKIEGSIDMEIKAGDGEYGLYMKIMSIPGADIFTPYYTNRIRVGTGAVVGEWVQLASVNVIVKAMVVISEWVQLAAANIAVKVAVVIGEWVQLAAANIAVKVVTVITDWILLTTKSITVAVSTKLGFKMTIWGIPSDFGSYDKWWCYYYDPAISDFVGDNKWHNLSDQIPFSNVKSGGYVAVFLLRNSTMSRQYTSPSFGAVNGGVYQYDLQLNRVAKIG